MKYIIEIEEKPLCVFDKDTQTFFPRLWRVKGFNSLVFDEDGLSRLEVLNSDYINEHYGELQDTAYKKGFEDGKAVNNKGCEGCLYNDGAKEHSPCDICRNAYLNRWTANQTDDEIKVGDVVMIKQFKHPENHLFVVTKVSDESVWGVEGDGSWNYWAINEVIKTDKHFDIDKILEEMRHD